MNQSIYQNNRGQLRQLMDEINCADIERLSALSGVSELEIYRLQSGLIPRLSLETIARLAGTLKIPVTDFIAKFTNYTGQVGNFSRELPGLRDRQNSRGELQGSQGDLTDRQRELEGETGGANSRLTRLQAEYQDLQYEYARQKRELTAEFQSASIETLESWLLQWPTAEAVARKNPQLSAVKLLPLVKPVIDLLDRWGVEQIHQVGEEVVYDPRIHQLMEGDADGVSTVVVRYVGYRQGDKLLYRAKVSLVNPPPSEMVE